MIERRPHTFLQLPTDFQQTTLRRITPPSPNSSAIHLCLVTARNAAILVLCIGISGVIGWALDLQVLKGAWTGGIVIKANTAIALSLSGLALWLQRLPGNPVSWQNTVAGSAAILVGLLGGLTLAEHLTGRDFGIDELFFRDMPGSLATSSPGRMGPPAAICFLLAGFALFGINGSSAKADLKAHVLGLAMCLIIAIPLIGYLFGVG